MRIRVLAAVGVLACMIAVPVARAQEGVGATSSVDSTQYLRARSLVANGSAVAGRQLVDSLLRRAQPGTAAYAEGLYWRATLAASATSAERDYRQIVVDYPLSPRVAESLLRLGQLEAARGDRAAALQHFQRINVEHPESPLHAEASYWIARINLEKNDLVRACAANADAMARVSPADIELKNRIEYQNVRCRGVAVAAPATATAAPVSGDTGGGRPAGVAGAPAVAPPAVSKPVPVYPGDRPVAAADQRRVEAAPAVAPPRVERARQPATVAGEAPRGERGWAVQVAAYSTRASADALAARLRARGLASHVDGSGAPYRVRIGHFSTRAAAVAELRRLKAQKIDGFVTQE